MTTTESEPATGTGNPAGSGESAENEAHAAARVPPRARGLDRNPAASGNASAGYRAWLSSHVEPPEVWSTPRESVRQIWWWAWRGKSAPESGLARLVLMAWGIIGCTVNAVLYFVVWLVTLPCYIGMEIPHPDVTTVQRPSGKDIWRAGWIHVSPVIKWWTVAALLAALPCYVIGWTAARLSRSLAAGLAYIVFAHVIGLPWPSWLP